ncbi:hypothetical protein DdX_20506 [Ditylenchus destructor]|uniref:Uncharacterized protein n=1 Tax=Ditylenchus destructor TaxID=166010 RepID=A0AAD4MH34_9BILA|nr:hypothetical protein DdX_20506 [Ditylenchus destructor]
MIGRRFKLQFCILAALFCYVFAPRNEIETPPSQNAVCDAGHDGTRIPVIVKFGIIEGSTRKATGKIFKTVWALGYEINDCHADDTNRKITATNFFKKFHRDWNNLEAVLNDKIHNDAKRIEIRFLDPKGHEGAACLEQDYVTLFYCLSKRMPLGNSEDYSKKLSNSDHRFHVPVLVAHLIKHNDHPDEPQGIDGKAVYMIPLIVKYVLETSPSALVGNQPVPAVTTSIWATGYKMKTDSTNVASFHREFHVDRDLLREYLGHDPHYNSDLHFLNAQGNEGKKVL